MNEYQLPKGQRILAVFAHPDDEAFGPGGTLALLAQQNEVRLICVTDGGMKVRAGELSAAAKILGIKEVIFFNYADGSLNNANYHQVAKDIQKEVDKFKPQILLTFDLKGVSGHLDHVAVAMITSYVYRENKTIKQIWYFCELEQRLKRLFLNHYFIFHPEGYLKEDIDLVVDVSKVYNTKIKAMRAHVSQKKDSERLILSRKLLPKEEYFLVKNR